MAEKKLAKPKAATTQKPEKTEKPAVASKSPAKAADDVDFFMTYLIHPLKSEIQAVRALILSIDKGITEGIKWNAPSFHFKDYFATIHIKATDCVQIILHLGAKNKDKSAENAGIADPSGLLQWLGKDRATVKLGSANEIKEKKAALKSIVEQWIRLM